MIKVNDYQFSYPNKTILQRVNLELFKDRHSNVLVFLGENGSGKSSFINSLSGLNQFQGVIKGILNNELSLVPQRPDLGHLQIGRIAEILGSHHKPPFSNRYIDELSGGEQRMELIKLMIGREKKFLILDEPDSFLDKNKKDELKTLIRTSSSKIILSTHDHSLANDLGDEFYLFKNQCITPIDCVKRIGDLHE